MEWSRVEAFPKTQRYADIETFDRNRREEIEFGGQFESAEAAGQRLVLLCIVVVAGIFFLLVTAFSSARDAALAMLNLPLALASGQPGSEIQAPMAIVILCGLITSTALNMVVVPALYLRFGAACRP